jgi:hypothetical protein
VDRALSCRSWLASDGGREISAKSNGLIASKPAPTQVEFNRSTCGSWLASDGGREISAKSNGLIASKPAPT